MINVEGSCSHLQRIKRLVAYLLAGFELFFMLSLLGEFTGDILSVDLALVKSSQVLSILPFSTDRY